MTDPIARGNPFRSDHSSTSSNESPSESRVPAADGALCREPSPASPYFDDATPTTRGTDALVSQNHSSVAARFAAHQSPHAPEDGVSDPEPERSPPTNNNAQRTAAELTVGTPALSLTVAGALGDGEETSVGLRDANHNGNVELCFRRSVSKFIVVGACVEPAAVTAGVRELYDAVVSKFNRETPVQ